jgi:hypothetical protein
VRNYREMRILCVALLAAACGGQSEWSEPATGEPTAEESQPVECTRHAQYSAPNYDVYLTAEGFSNDGCHYIGSVFLGYPGSHRDDAGELGATAITFAEAGSLVSCSGPGCSAFDGAAPVLESCTEGAVDVNRDPMPAGSCGIVRFE